MKGPSHPASINHWMTQLYNEKRIGAKIRNFLLTSHSSLGKHLCELWILGFYLSCYFHVSVMSFSSNAILCHIILILFDAAWSVEASSDEVEPSPDGVK